MNGSLCFHVVSGFEVSYPADLVTSSVSTKGEKGSWWNLCSLGGHFPKWPYLIIFNVIRLEAIASRLEAIASRLEAIASRLEAIASRLEAIAVRLEAIASSHLGPGLHGALAGPLRKGRRLGPDTSWCHGRRI